MKLLTLLLVSAALLPGQPRYARLGEFQGQVDVQLTAADAWMPAEHNLPLTQSAWLRTGTESRLEIELDDGSAWRLGPDSQGEISDYTRLSTGQRVTLLSLDHGISYFTGEPKAKDVVMLVMPGVQATLSQGSRIRVTVQPAGSQIAVLEGQVRFSSPAAEFDIHEGTTARVDPAAPSRFVLDPEVTGGPLDRWSEDRDKVQAAPQSAAFVTAHYGLADLDAAGVWMSTADLGVIWKPEVSASWAPYQNGRWRYFEALGYTWVSDDAWGWLPFHNGRWARKENLGWVWQPAVSTIFRPGEVYWLRGAGFTGWGPLAPGEQWTPPSPGAIVPRAYSAGIPTFAAFQPDVRLVDPAGFASPSAEQLKSAVFVAALPSPAFLVSRLDATRPVLQVGSTRLTPSVSGVTFGDTPPDPVEDVSTAANNDPPLPHATPIVADASAVAVPPPDGVYPVPVAVLPVVEVPVVINPPVHQAGKATATPASPAADTTTSSKTIPAPALPKRPVERPPVPDPKNPPPGSRGTMVVSAEQAIYQRVVEDINPAAPNFVKALSALNVWASSFPVSAFANDRLYYYIHVYNGLGRADKVLEVAAPVVSSGVAASFHDPAQVLQILVAASSGMQSLPKPTAQQLATGQNAARQLLEFVPNYFAPRNKPPSVSDAAWSQARAQLDAVAKQALAR